MAALIILDTDVLIDHFRGVEEAREYLANLSIENRRITDITVMELLKGAENKKELGLILKFLDINHFKLLHITRKASQMAVELLKQYGLSEGINIPDALIASITLTAKGRLISGNWRHFRFISRLVVEAPPYRGQLSV